MTKVKTTILIDDKLHRLFKKLCIDQQVQMSQKLEKMINDTLMKEYPRGGEAYGRTTRKTRK